MVAPSLAQLQTLVSSLTPNQATKLPHSYYSLPLTTTLNPTSLHNLWLKTNTSLGLRAQLPKLRTLSTAICLSLPTANREIVSSEDKVPKWSRSAIKSFAMGELEARKLKYPTTGTEAILMGILIEGTSLASKFLRANGITLFKVREEAIKIFGKSSMFYWSPEHPTLTDEAQRVLDWAVDKQMKSGDGGEITTSHLLLGIWYEVDSPGHKILATLGFNEGKVKELESLMSSP